MDLEGEVNLMPDALRRRTKYLHKGTAEKDAASPSFTGHILKIENLASFSAQKVSCWWISRGRFPVTKLKHRAVEKVGCALSTPENRVQQCSNVVLKYLRWFLRMKLYALRFHKKFALTLTEASCAENCVLQEVQFAHKFTT